jgi:hypothetical protein
MEQKEPENAARSLTVLKFGKVGSAFLRTHILKPKAHAPMLAESLDLKIRRDQTSQRAHFEGGQRIEGRNGVGCRTLWFSKLRVLTFLLRLRDLASIR